MSIRRRLFAKYYDRAIARYERILKPRKQALLAGLSGTVVEIGPGTGVNLELLPPGIRWIGIEPNLHMHPILRAKAEALGLEVDLRLLSGEDLPLEDQSVDYVLTTLVMCSVPEPQRVFSEILRVLRPGGRYVFWEHVLAPNEQRLLRALQHGLTPFHRVFAGGCRCNRDMALELRQASFGSLELESFRVPKEAAPAWVGPHVTGTATK
jgi:SAM-dependent methyltransferase